MVNIFNRNQKFKQDDFLDKLKDNLSRYENDEYATYWLNQVFTPEWYVRMKEPFTCPCLSANLGGVDSRRKNIVNLKECF